MGGNGDPGLDEKLNKIKGKALNGAEPGCERDCRNRWEKEQSGRVAPNQASCTRVGQPIFCWRSISSRSSLARR